MLSKNFKAVIAAALTMVMVLGIAWVPAFADNQSFEAKVEIALNDWSWLVFSENPIRYDKNEDFYGGRAYVFPVGTKVARVRNGLMVWVTAIGETDFLKGDLTKKYSEQVVELVLTEKMREDKKGIRLCFEDTENSVVTVFVGGADTEPGLSDPSFEVKEEIEIFDGSVLLFSEESIGEDPDLGFYGGAYIFPEGTKVAQRLAGLLFEIDVIGESCFIEGNARVPYPDKDYELTLTKEKFNDENGIRICSSFMGRGLKTISIAESADSIETDSIETTVTMTIGDEYLTKNGENIKIDEANFVVPYISEEGRTMVPLRAISESLGAVVDWNAESKTVTITLGDSKVEVVIDAQLPDGMGTAVLSAEGRTFVPLRYVAEALGAVVDWNAETRTVTINKQ